MTLFEQFQTIIGSIVFGFVSMLIYTFFNRLFFNKKLIVFRLIFETILFCFIAYLYYIFISEYGSGIFNIFYIFSLILGSYLFYRFYAYYFESFFENIFSFLSKKLIDPIKLKIKKIHAKLKVRKKYEKEIKQKNK